MISYYTLLKQIMLTLLSKNFTDHDWISFGKTDTTSNFNSEKAEMKIF